MTPHSGVRRFARWIARPLRTTALLVAALALVAAAAAQSYGGTARIHILSMPESFNPVLPIELNGLIVTGSMYAPIAAVNPETFATEPYLAERWEVSEDLLTWTFHLRQNALWHDGVPITAQDVKFTYDRIMDPDEGANGYVTTQKWASVEVVDDHTFRIVLKEPNALLPDVLSSGGFEPLPRHVFEGFARLSEAVDVNTRNPVGSGAFKMSRVEAGNVIVVEAFEDFFFGRPYLDRLEYRIVGDQNAAVAQALAGDLDWLPIQPVHRGPVEANPRLTSFTAVGTRYVMMAINMADYEPWRTLFQDARVRQAMMYAIDREEIVQRVAGGLVPVQHGMIPDTLAWVPKPDIEPYTYDPERARALLDEAGWVPGPDGVRVKDGQRLSFYVLVDRGNAAREQIGLVLQAGWQDIGMEVEYVVSERTGRWIEETRAGTFPTRVSTFPIPNPDWAYRLFHSAGLNNSQKYVNAEVDARLEAMFATADRDVQGQMLKEMQELVHADPFVMPFYIEPDLHAIDAALQDVPRSELKLAVLYAFRVHRE
jgi:peptide/nickel transport system substrate-binding protein